MEIGSGDGKPIEKLMVLLLAISMLAVGEAKTIVVGGSENWHLGFNYTDWALKTSPFFINDTLVFKYDPPSNGSEEYSVYMLPNLWSYVKCDFQRAKLLAGPTQGSGEGFSYLLKQFRPQYFASTGQDGGSRQCNQGMMKFFVVPHPRRKF